MGLLIDGKWDEDADPAIDKTGAFVRANSKFRNWITADGKAGPSGEDGFAAEAGRYHLFVAASCPWAHRTIMFRALKGLGKVITMTLADAPKSEGWSFTRGLDEMQPRADGIFRLHQVYTAAEPGYTGKVTVPTLWDRKRKTVVNNESSEIIRMLNSAFAQHGATGPDFYPTALRDKIDEINAFVYKHINNGVYRTGFSKSQSAYEAAVTDVFHGLDTIEALLSKQRYLVGNRITEADWRLFATLLRFDIVYYGHFKCNVRRIQDYPSLREYTRELYQWPDIAATCDVDAIKSGYYGSQKAVNPTGIIPRGPDTAWLHVPHSRDHVR